MKKILLFLSVLLATGFFIKAQDNNEPILLKIAGDQITRSEFEKVYRKNNAKETNFDRKSLEDYLELYINYKLKVKEAEALKMDTSAAFINELAGYRKQLAQPYLVDKEVTENLIKEAYDRMKKDVRASHILIRLEENALPKDTLAAYNKIIKIRERLTKGADFVTVAKEVSEDPSAKDNGGDLGYFTGMQMVYPFETVAYNTKAGQISMPVRTRFGYHLVKVADIRDAKGEVMVAHIMIKMPTGSIAVDSIAAETKVNEIYAKLQGGEDFAELAARFSDDLTTSKNGGALAWFGTGRMVPEFEKVAFNLKNNGDYSQPVQTSYGFHIIKLLDKRGISSFEEKQGELKAQIARDSRSEVSRISMINRIKKESGFKEFPKVKDEMFKVADSTLIDGEWSAARATGMNKVMFSLTDKNYTQTDFAAFVENHQTKRTGSAPAVIMNSFYDQFVEESILSYEESRLDLKYPDFKALMQEYRDGILLFDLTDNKVWSKAVKDTVGLAAFYESNKSNYMWGQRVKAVVYTCANEVMAEKTRKLLKKKKTTRELLLAEVNKSSQLNLNIREGLFAKGEYEIIDQIEWKKGLSQNVAASGSVVFVDIKEVLSPQPKSLDECRGLVTSDYQTALEKEWISELRSKFPVELNKEVLNTLVRP